MKTWMKLGAAGLALAGLAAANEQALASASSSSALADSTSVRIVPNTINAAKAEASRVNGEAQIQEGFRIEASDLIAKKARDYVKDPQLV